MYAILLCTQIAKWFNLNSQFRFCCCCCIIKVNFFHIKYAFKACFSPYYYAFTMRRLERFFFASTTKTLGYTQMHWLAQTHSKHDKYRGNTISFIHNNYFPIYSFALFCEAFSSISLHNFTNLLISLADFYWVGRKKFTGCCQNCINPEKDFFVHMNNDVFSSFRWPQTFYTSKRFEDPTATDFEKDERK